MKKTWVTKKSIWVTKKSMSFSNDTVPHLNLESFLKKYLVIWGRVVFTKDFNTGSLMVEVQSEEEVP
mgnify:CR=1 FL=1